MPVDHSMIDNNEPVPLSELRADTSEEDYFSSEAFSELRPFSEESTRSRDSSVSFNVRVSSTFARSQSVSGDPLICRKIGSSIGQFWNNGEYSISLGADINNPNTTLTAKNITVEVTLKDSSGRILKVINDSINTIDAGKTFHYGMQQSGIVGEPVTFSVSAYARDYEESNGDMVSETATFLNPYFRPDGAWGSLTGELQNNRSYSLDGANIYFQFVNATGEIVGGASEWIDYLPANGVRSIQYNGFIPDSIKKINYSLDIR